MPRTTLTACVMAAFLPALFAQESPRTTQSYPNVAQLRNISAISICEGGKCEVLNCYSRACSSDGNAVTYIRRLDPAGVTLERKDDHGELAGLVSVYTGKISGARIEGVVSKSWEGHRFHPKEGPFTATITDPADYSLENEYRLLAERQRSQAQAAQQAQTQQSLQSISLLGMLLGAAAGDSGSSDAGSGLTGRISSLKDDVDRAWQRCMTRRDNQCHDRRRLRASSPTPARNS